MFWWQYWEPLVLETREGQGANTAEPSVNTSAQQHCNHQVEQKSTECYSGAFMTQMFKLLGLMMFNQLSEGQGEFQSIHFHLIEKSQK